MLLLDKTTPMAAYHASAGRIRPAVYTLPTPDFESKSFYFYNGSQKLCTNILFSVKLNPTSHISFTNEVIELLYILEQICLIF